MTALRRLTSLAGILALLLGSGCRRHDLRTMLIDVPDMETERDATIVANMLALELARHETHFRVDLELGTILNGRRGRLMARPVAGNSAEVLIGQGGQGAQWVSERDLRRRIMTGFAKAGLSVQNVVVTPTNPGRPDSDAFQVVVTCSNVINDVRMANIAVGALAMVLQGGVDPRVSVNVASRTVSVTYDSLKLSFRNLEHAVSLAGYRANDVPPNLGAQEPIQYGW